MKLLLGIDLGTSSVKAIIITDSGIMLSKASEEYDIISTNKVFKEQNPNTWWEKTCECIRKVISKIPYKNYNIEGIGLSGQMHSLVILDKKYTPIDSAIIWCDQRSSTEVNEINDLLTDNDFSNILLNSVTTGFQISSLLWVKKNEYQKYRKIRYVISAKDYIRYKLTGEIGTEPSDASGTLLFDVNHKKWAYTIMNKLGIDTEIFPKIYSSSSIVGYITKLAEEKCNIPVGTPVICGGGDQPVQAVGNGIINEGVLSSTIGTGGQLLTVINKPKYDNKYRTHTFAHIIPEKWYIMGASLASGLSLKWFCSNILKCNSFEKVDEYSKKNIPGSNGLLFLPYLIGERTPYMDPKAKGIFFGLTIDHNYTHMAAAVLEGIVFALRTSYEIIKELGIKIERVVASGGGSRSNLMLQIQANIFNLKVYKSTIEEQAGVGAAILAGVGSGVYKSFKEACKQVVRYSDKVTEPQEKAVNIYNELYLIFKDLYKSNKENFENLDKVVYKKITTST